MKKTIRISTRAVYHKIAHVDIQVPADLNGYVLLDWIYDNDDLWSEKLDQSLAEAEYNYGRGLDGDDGFDDDSSDHETRFYVCDETGEQPRVGGHL